jgi:hypothetical protein
MFLVCFLPPFTQYGLTGDQDSGWDWDVEVEVHNMRQVLFLPSRIHWQFFSNPSQSLRHTLVLPPAYTPTFRPPPSPLPLPCLPRMYVTTSSLQVADSDVNTFLPPNLASARSPPSPPLSRHSFKSHCPKSSGALVTALCYTSMTLSCTSHAPTWI